MSPDSLESRFARLEQRMADQESRFERRLDELVQDLRAFRSFPVELATFKAEVIARMARQEERSNETALAVRDLVTRIDAREEARAKEHAVRAAERKADRRYQVATALVVAGLIIAAIQFLVNGGL